MSATPRRAVDAAHLSRLLWPVVAFLFCFYLFPLARTLSLGVTEPSPGIEHFVKAFSTRIYRTIFLNTFEIGLSVAALCLIVAYPTALFIVSRRPRTAGLLLICVVVPFFTSLLVRNYAWIFMLGSRGVVNSLLLWAGIVDKPLPLMFNRFGVVLGMTHILLPYAILILVGVLRGIDPTLVRAAATLGSGPFSAFRRVVLPLSLAGAGGAFILVFVIALAFFVTPAMLGSPRETMIANVIASEVGFLRWGFAAALGIILLAVTLLAIAALLRFFGGIALIAPGLRTGGERRRARRVGPFDRWLRLADPWLDRAWPWLVAICGGAALAFLVLPVVITVPLSLSAAEYFVFPPPGWSLKWYAAYFADRRWLAATANSVQVALCVVAATMAMAIPAALGIVRSTSRWVSAVYLLIVSPLIVPTIIIAIAVFFQFTELGLSRTLTAIVIGHTIGALPLAIVVLVAALANFDWNLERASLSLGASRLKTTVKITLPIIGGAVGTAAFLAFLHSFDDLLIALFLSGLRTETLPKRMWESLQEINPTIAAVSSLLIAFVTILLAALQAFRATRRVRAM